MPQYLLNSYPYNISKENGYSTRHFPVITAEHDVHPNLGGKPIRYLVGCVFGTYLACDTIEEAISELSRLTRMSVDDQFKEMLEALGYNPADFYGKDNRKFYDKFKKDQYALWRAEQDSRRARSGQAA